MKINILGQDYEMLMQDEDENPKIAEHDGLVELYSKKIVINKNFDLELPDTAENAIEFIDHVVTHEIVHAFLHESGLNKYTHDEVLVDWIASQLPKMSKAVQDFEEFRGDFYGDLIVDECNCDDDEYRGDGQSGVRGEGESPPGLHFDK